ncbi:hypothetical protein OUZ56_003355 [Daphnia magna]|uniref:Uncharacterized protein n=1 Tax=Daphnia magna TaxID=35525 RepID=A0ABR0A8H0_9CRUS|nr:hypothetical protein OUZ56_003355 [Daphnia magna]
MNQMATEEDLLAEVEVRRPIEIGMIMENDCQTHNPFFSNNNQNNENHGGQEDEMMDLEAQVLCDTPEDRVPNVVEVEDELEPEEVLDIDPIAP